MGICDDAVVADDITLDIGLAGIVSVGDSGTVLLLAGEPGLLVKAGIGLE